MTGKGSGVAENMNITKLYGWYSHYIKFICGKENVPFYGRGEG